MFDELHSDYMGSDSQDSDSQAYETRKVRTTWCPPESKIEGD